MPRIIKKCVQDSGYISLLDKTNLGTFLNAWTGNPRLY